ATETQYLVAGARIVWDSEADGLLPPIDRNRRATINVTDLLGTTGAVVDLLSGDLVEVSTYYPNGARENLWTNDALVPIEPMGFTTKEADEEIGVTYFGERWLIPRLGRWATPDPLHIHASGGGEALNSYHYVSGNLLQAVDPLGLNATVAEHVNTRERIVERRIHLGYLAVRSRPLSGNVPRSADAGTPLPVTEEELRRAAEDIESRLRDTYRDFEIQDGGYTYRYTFDIEVEFDASLEPVQPRPTDGQLDTVPAREARLSALERGLENVVIVAPQNPGVPHAPRIPGAIGLAIGGTNAIVVGLDQLVGRSSAQYAFTGSREGAWVKGDGGAQLQWCLRGRRAVDVRAS
ncbi:MAG: RHS repeat-associated core domain-containing protein, partial [Deltaproteobacteria bacterium]